MSFEPVDMDLLSGAYESESEDEDAEKPTPSGAAGLGTPSLKFPSEPCCSKRDFTTVQVSPTSPRTAITHHGGPRNDPTALKASAVQGYIPRRKRKQPPEPPESGPSHQPSPAASVLSSYFTTTENPSLIRKQSKNRPSVPKRREGVCTEHTKPVLSLGWHPCDPRLLLSASLDGDVKLWDVERKAESVTTYKLHRAAVRAVEWVTSETAISAGYDRAAVYMDAAQGREIARLRHTAYVSVVRAHP